MDSDDSGLVEFAEFVKVMSNKEGEAGDAVKHSLVRFKNGGENVCVGTADNVLCIVFQKLQRNKKLERPRLKYRKTKKLLK